MKSTRYISLLAALAIACLAGPGMAQNTLGRLESEIRQANGQPAAATLPVGQRVYLGAIALDDARGVRITSVRSGGPAERAGLLTQDLVVGAAGRRIRMLSELTGILGNMNPGDRLALEVMRGTRPLRIEVVLGAPPTGVPHLAERPSLPPTPGQGSGQSVVQNETIPPPPSEPSPSGIPPVPMTAPSTGPQLEIPSNPTAPNGAQAQIEELRHRVDQLELRVKELERALAESQKK